MLTLIRHWRIGAVVGLWLGLARPAAAQPAPTGSRQRVTPYVTFLAGDRPAVGAALRVWRPTDSAARTPYARVVRVAAGLGFGGGARVEGRFVLPAARGFRVALLGQASWQERAFFHGLGNEAAFDRQLEPDYYRVSRNRAWGRAEMTRWLGSGLAVAGAVGLDRVSYTALPGPSVFAEQYGTHRDERDATVGVTLVYDRRNLERMAGRGVLLEAGVVAGRGYQRAFGLAQLYVPIGDGSVYAARAVASSMSAGAPLVARLQIPAWESQLLALGGNESLRGLRRGRYAGRGVLFLNQEVRRDLGRIRRVPVVGIGFVDAGRVFEADRFRFTSSGMKVAGGIGLSVRGDREWRGSTLIAVGPDGLRVSGMSGWAF